MFHVHKDRCHLTKNTEVFYLMGKPELEGRISDNEVSYWLKSDGFLAMWELYIYFDDNGSFKSAVIAYAIKNRRIFFQPLKLAEKIS